MRVGGGVPISYMAKVGRGRWGVGGVVCEGAIGGRREGNDRVIHSRSLTDRRLSHPHNSGTKRVDFSPTRRLLRAPSAKRC